MRVNNSSFIYISSPSFEKRKKKSADVEKIKKENYRKPFIDTLAGNFNYHIINREKVNLKDFENNPISAVIIKTGKTSKSMFHKGLSLGNCNFSECSAKINGDNYPDFYKGKPYLFINSLASSKKFKGIGTELVKSVVRESKRRGYEGRVCLNASVVEPEFGSPIPFYSKLGFQSSDLNKQIIIDYVMKNDLSLPDNCQSATMFLPKEAIDKLLNT